MPIYTIVLPDGFEFDLDTGDKDYGTPEEAMNAFKESDKFRKILNTQWEQSRALTDDEIKRLPAGVNVYRQTDRTDQSGDKIIESVTTTRSGVGYTYNIPEDQDPYLKSIEENQRLTESGKKKVRESYLRGREIGIYADEDTRDQLKVRAGFENSGAAAFMNTLPYKPPVVGEPVSDTAQRRLQLMRDAQAIAFGDKKLEDIEQEDERRIVGRIVERGLSFQNPQDRQQFFDERIRNADNALQQIKDQAVYTDEIRKKYTDSLAGQYETLGFAISTPKESGTLGWMKDFGREVAGASFSPENLIGLGVEGTAKNVFARALQRGAIGSAENVLAEIAIQPLIQQQRAQTGQPSGLKESARDVGYAALFGFGFAGTLGFFQRAAPEKITPEIKERLKTAVKTEDEAAIRDIADELGISKDQFDRALESEINRRGENAPAWLEQQAALDARQLGITPEEAMQRIIAREAQRQRSVMPTGEIPQRGLTRTPETPNRPPEIKERPAKEPPPVRSTELRTAVDVAEQRTRKAPSAADIAELRSKEAEGAENSRIELEMQGNPPPNVMAPIVRGSGALAEEVSGWNVIGPERLKELRKNSVVTGSDVSPRPNRLDLPNMVDLVEQIEAVKKKVASEQAKIDLERSRRAEGIETALAEQERASRSPKQLEDLQNELRAIEGDDPVAEARLRNRIAEIAADVEQGKTRERRVTAIESELTAEERVRQSPLSAEMLREDLRKREAVGREPEIDVPPRTDGGSTPPTSTKPKKRGGLGSKGLKGKGTEGGFVSPPEWMMRGLERGSELFHSGVRTLNEWARRMVDEFGDVFSSDALAAIWSRVKNLWSDRKIKEVGSHKQWWNSSEGVRWQTGNDWGTLRRMIHGGFALARKAKRGNNLPPLFDRIREQSGFITEAEIRDVQFDHSRLEKLTKRLEKKDPSIRGKLNDYFEGRTGVDTLPEDMHEAAASVRNKIDDLSMKLAAELDIPVSLQETLLGNLGKYLSRSYEVFDNAKWGNKLRKNNKAVIDRAVRGFMDEWGLSKDEAEALVVRLIDGDRTQLGQFLVGSSPIAKKDVGSLMKRDSDLPKWFRDLLGEYTDPLEKSGKTLSKQVRLLMADRMQRSVVQRGLELGWFSETPSATHADKLVGDSSKAYSRLAGYYVQNEIKSAIEDTFRNAQVGAIGKLYHDLFGLSKAAKVLFNVPVSYITNFTTAPWLSAMSGHWGLFNPATTNKASWIGQAGRALGSVMYDWIGDPKKTTLAGLDKRKLIEEIKIVQAQGLIDQNILLSDLDKTIGHAHDPVQRFMNSRAVRGLAAGFQAGDQWPRIATFWSNVERYKKAFFPDTAFDGLSKTEKKQLYDIAGERTRQEFQNYDEIPYVVRWASKHLPFVNSFVAFPYSLARAAMYIPYNGMRELASGIANKNTALAKIGAQKLISPVILIAGMELIRDIAYDNRNLNEQEMEALRPHLPFWSKNSDVIPVTDLKNGKMLYNDSSYIMPLTILSEAGKEGFKAAQENGPIDGVTRAAYVFGQNFVGDNVAIQPVVELLTNRDENGRVIVPEKGKSEARLWADRLVNAAVEAFKPGTARTIRNLMDPDKRRSEILKMAGLRNYEMDVYENTKFSAFQLNKEINQTKSELTRALRNATTDGEREAAMELASRSMEDIQNRFLELRKSYSIPQLDVNNFYKILREAGVSAEIREELMKGAENLSFEVDPTRWAETDRARELASGFDSMSTTEKRAAITEIQAMEPERRKLFQRELGNIRAGVTESDIILKNKGVRDGSRAEAILIHINSLPEGERNQELRRLIQLRVNGEPLMSDTVVRQYQVLSRRERRLAQ